MKPRASRQQGFSLVELLVTALIFAIGLLGLAALQVSTMRTNTGGRNRFTATSLAEGCMSAIQAEGASSWAYAAGIVGNGTAYPLPKVYTGGNLGANFGFFDINGQPVATGDPAKIFTVSWVQRATGNQVPSAGISGLNLREFVVTVSWWDQVTDAKGIALTTPNSMSMSRLIRY
jgi:prepilin-type N-terminal cleavage/methylation domain-containing protein